ncbi:hypothetical protein CERSUDRAFT_102357 [Gelatoporia subvermispora B]|uniref:Tethering factor for nuclear proteasome STS1 n=1 Tax=Ceriporiopsis subvermispora (strain B) TaxID=914234 RepID=M2RSS3_CERS8|nr:hypothetical protein CERSUDRAFT_102357 [Gelatoporia subvermispora B]
MANVVTPTHLALDFRRGNVDHTTPSLGFGFGLASNSVMSGWAAASTHTQSSPWNQSPHNNTLQPRIAKRRHEPDDDIENRHTGEDAMDRSPTPERPKRAAPKRARTTPAVVTTGKGEKNVKDDKNAPSEDGDDVDVGVLLASLPPQSLLPLLNSLISAQPSLKSTILSLIPRPTLDTALQALADSAQKLRNAYPYSNTPFSQPGASTTFGFGASRPTSGGSFGNPAQVTGSSTFGGMREEYVLSRLRPHIADFVSACFSYLPYFSYVTTPIPTSLSAKSRSQSHAQSHASALQSQHKDKSHPSETYLLLSALLSHVLSQPPLTQSSLVPLVLPRLTEEWRAWTNHVDEVVNRQGGMFGQETVRTWERGLDEFAQAKGNGLDVMRQIRDEWVSKVGWLVGRQQMEEL